MDHAHGILHLFDRYVVDQLDFGSGPYVYPLQGRKSAGNVLDTAFELNVGRCKHAAMRVDAAHSAQAVALEQQLLFELYLIVSTQLRTHVNGRGVLELRGAVFEGQLMAGTGPSLVVKGPLSQNEVVVVEVKLRGVCGDLRILGKSEIRHTHDQPSRAPPPADPFSLSPTIR